MIVRLLHHDLPNASNIPCSSLRISAMPVKGRGFNSHSVQCFIFWLVLEIIGGSWFLVREGVVRVLRFFEGWVGGFCLLIASDNNFELNTRLQSIGITTYITNSSRRSSPSRRQPLFNIAISRWCCVFLDLATSHPQNRHLHKTDTSTKPTPPQNRHLHKTDTSTKPTPPQNRQANTNPPSSQCDNPKLPSATMRAAHVVTRLDVEHQ
jgi:hypothetical protein